jgi:hypothetical protein
VAQNNLRIIYNNLTDVAGTTVTVSSTASSSTVVAKMLTDYKGEVWRSANMATTLPITFANIRIVFTTPSIVSGVILAYTNLRSDASIRVRGYVGTAPTLTGTTDAPTITENGLTLFDTDFEECNPPAGLGQFQWGLEGLGITGNELRKGYSRIWIPLADRVPCTSLTIEIQNPGNVDRYIEVGRLIIGDYWSPTYNTSFGLSANFKDTSSAERSEAGDLITVNGIQYPSVSFDLKYLNIKDRNEFNRLIKNRGTKKPLFVSLFPDNTGDYVKEQMHQIYGKQVQLFGISHPIFDMYSSQVEIEEI